MFLPHASHSHYRRRGFAFRGSDSTQLNILVWPRSMDLSEGTIRLSYARMKTLMATNLLGTPSRKWTRWGKETAEKEWRGQRDHWSDGQRECNPPEDLRVNYWTRALAHTLRKHSTYQHTFNRRVQAGQEPSRHALPIPPSSAPVFLLAALHRSRRRPPLLLLSPAATCPIFDCIIALWQQQQQLMLIMIICLAQMHGDVVLIHSWTCNPDLSSLLVEIFIYTCIIYFRYPNSEH